ncbi:Speract receptor, partial [Eumeta japonica]
MLLAVLNLFGKIEWQGQSVQQQSPNVDLVEKNVSVVLYRNWRYEQELDSLLWKIDFREIQMHEKINCPKQKDILENEDVKLDNMFIASMVADIIRVCIDKYIHMAIGNAMFAKVLQAENALYPYRPSLQPLETSFDCVREILEECWSEKPDDRPDFKTIRAKLRPLRKGMKPNIFDNMMSMMEKYANNLEALVDEKELTSCKRRKRKHCNGNASRPVAEQLK